MAIQNVALVGANGSLGPFVLQALVDSNQFSVTVLKRASSKSSDQYPASVKVKHIPDDFELGALAKILHGIDAIVTTVTGNSDDAQKSLADAAVVAGVKRFIPADFGSCDSQSKRARELVPLYQRKTEVREYLQALSAKNPGFTWTSLVTGHFFDWDLRFLHVDTSNRKVDFLDDGKTKWSASTRAQIGRAVVKVLEKADLDATVNKVLYVQSFRVTQLEVFEAVKRASKHDDWQVTSVESTSFTNEEKAKAEAGDKEAIEELVWVLGTLEADWQTHPGLANELIGLEQESMPEVIDRVLREIER
jgi:nucleoside-diphosphate-sugar epimerase